MNVALANSYSGQLDDTDDIMEQLLHQKSKKWYRNVYNKYLPTDDACSIHLDPFKPNSESYHDTVTNSQYEQFIKYVIDNEIEKLASLDNLKDLLAHISNYKYKKPILLLVCEDKGIFTSVTPETVNFLIEKEANVDYIDKEWYCWEALHYAALAANPNKLEIICNKLGKERINTLTALSENALHILLDHGTYAESFNVACQNGDELKMLKIIGCEKENIVKCVEILLEAGIDVNHSNFWNETPLLVAIKRKYFQVVKLLLQTKDIDLDSSRGAISRKTARELLKGKEAYFELLPKQRSITDPEKILFRLIKSGDEEAFLKFNGGRISGYVDAIDGDNDNNSSCTLLQYCFRRGLIAWYQDKKKHEYESQFQYSDITANYLVQVFCQSGMARSIQHLLDNGANTELVLRKFDKPLLEVAAIKGYYPLVCLILGQDNNTFSPEKICDIIETVIHYSDNSIDLDNTLTVLLNRLLISDQTLSDEALLKLMKVLSLGVRKIHKENISLLLKFPGSLATINKDNKPVLEEIDPEVIHAHLDECVQQKDNFIHISYDSFIKDDSTNHVIQNFVDSSILNTHLNHLVFKILIHRKWEHLHWYWNNKYFHLNLYFNFLLCILLNVYVLLKFNNVSGNVMNIFYNLSLTGVGIFIFKEVTQLIADWRLYLQGFQNFTEIFFIISSFWVFLDPNHISMVISVLSSNLVLLLLLEQVPKFAKYIIILRTVAYYLKYLIFYFIQFLAFAICFYILFSKPDQKISTDLPNKIFETIILFTGNLDYMDTNEFEKSELFSKIVFTLFVLFMAIILHNLLLGLLVTDMSDLTHTVTIFEQLKRAQFVVRLEKFLTSKIVKWFPKFVLNNYRKGDIFDTNYTIIVNKTDRKMLKSDEKHHLDFILAKRVKKQNVLKKLYSYMKLKINELSSKEVPKEMDKELLQRLQIIEERIDIILKLNATSERKNVV